MEQMKKTDARYSILDARTGPASPKCFAEASKAGSALILTVVLTSLLAIIGILFVMAANMDKLSTSSVSANKELQFAVDTVVAEISQQLIKNVPGPNNPAANYYDYPGTQKPWLASLELDNNNNWPQISDVTGYINRVWGLTGTQTIPLTISNAIIDEHAKIIVDGSGHITGIPGQYGQYADADGDGVADSKWIELETASGKPALTKSGRQIYAAIRIVDNGAMLNANTGYMYDTTHAAATDPCLSDGSNQLQINFLALATMRPSNTLPANADTQLWQLRYPNSTLNATSFTKYKNDVVWRYYEPNQQNTKYTPFDISDELELRNRFVVNNSDIDTRLESWGGQFRNTVISTPLDNSSTNTDLTNWYQRVHDNDNTSNLATAPNTYYAYRHIATTFNMDRIIDPNGQKMVCVEPNAATGGYNKADANSIFSAVKKALTAAEPNNTNINATAAQIAVNLVDYCDNDSNVTTLSVGGTTYYGFERPCIYISEIAYKSASCPDPADNTKTINAYSYAIELFEPYTEDTDPNNWQLVVNGTVVEGPIHWTTGSKRFHVVVLEDPNMATCSTTLASAVNFNDPGISTTGYNQTSYVVSNTQGKLPDSFQIALQRPTNAGFITVDSHSGPPLISQDGTVRSNERDFTDPNLYVKQDWRESYGTSPTLGKPNGYTSGDKNGISAHPANKPLVTIGEIGKILCKTPYTDGSIALSLQITKTDTEATAKVDLTNKLYQKLFDYLTVLNPSVYSWNEPNETRIKGRININTAPWYVIAQLPGLQSGKAAKEICTQRDIVKGFSSIGQLMDPANNIPDMLNNSTPTPGTPIPFEQRDSFFSRISNLATVRSDVFTAYILVRLGTDGPQKRVIAILDRSDVYSAKDKVKIIALWPVPDSR